MPNERAGHRAVSVLFASAKAASSSRFFLLPLLFVALWPLAALGAPLVVSVGAAQATLTLTPDPPQVGKVHALVTLSGIPRDALESTTAAFETTMPSMSMAGPSGDAQRTAAGRYEFDAQLGMAASWNITVHFSGGVRGTATYRVPVGVVSPSATAMPAMAGMPTTSKTGISSSGDPGAWRNAGYALVLIFILGLIAVVLVRRDRRALTAGIAIAAAALTVILAAVQARYAAPSMDMAAMTAVRGDAPTPVTFAPVRPAQGNSDVFAPGSIAPYLTQDVVTRAAGVLLNFNAYAGDRVQAGQVIATLDAPDLQSRAAAAAADAAAQADTARAAAIEAQHHAPNGVVIANAATAAMGRDLAAAQAERTAKAEQLRYWQNEVTREAALLQQGAVSQQEYQDERAQAAAARAAYDGSVQRISALQQQLLASRTKAADAVASVGQMQALAASAQAHAARAQANASTEATLAGFTTVRSPSDATVIKRLVDPGVYVQSGTPIARIAVVDRLRVQTNVAQSDLRGISEGTPIDVRLSDGSVVRGRVSSVSPVADPATHTAAVEAIVANTRGRLVPGGFVRVTLHARTARVPGGLQVPSAAIVGAGSGAAVWTSVNNSAHRVAVNVISDDGTLAIVTGRLGPGARVVVDGAPALEEGQALVEQRP